MNTTDLKEFFLALTQSEISEDRLSVAADRLRMAAGFQCLEQVGCATPDPSAFDSHLWPEIDMELVAAGHQPIFSQHCDILPGLKAGASSRR